VARSGINARQSLVELVPKLKGQRADLVLLALGVNDVIEFHTAQRWVSDVEILIEAIRAEVGDVPVLLAGVPPLNCFPALRAPLSFVLGARSAALGQASVKLATRMKRVVHVPFEIDHERGVELFCADGFHPSELGYKLWAEQLAAGFARFNGAVARPSGRA
jgi:lysophospholipase L1-like esterase